MEKGAFNYEITVGKNNSIYTSENVLSLCQNHFFPHNSSKGAVLNPHCGKRKSLKSYYSFTLPTLSWHGVRIPLAFLYY